MTEPWEVFGRDILLQKMLRLRMYLALHLQTFYPDPNHEGGEY